MRRALIVGINDYPGARLTGCVKDACSMAAVLEKHGSGAPNFEILRLNSPPADVTRHGLREAVEKLFATECEAALFFFSGHGYIRGTGAYLVTKDTAEYDEGVSMVEILKMANDSSARNKVIILDCCFSGNMGTPNIVEGGVAQLAEGLTVLAASRGSEVAMEQDEGGLFTELVVEALQGGAADIRGHITSGSIYAYVDQALGAWEQRPIFKTNVTQSTLLREVPPQVPMETLRKLADYFKNPKDEHVLDPSYENTREEPNPDNVEVFKNLQKMEGVGLVVPVDEDHMYFAAMNSKACRLTPQGARYWRLAVDKKL